MTLYSRDPNGEGLPVWVEYTKESPRYIEFKGVPDEFYIRDELRERYCAFWTEINNQTYRNPTP